MSNFQSTSTARRAANMFLPAPYNPLLSQSETSGLDPTIFAPQSPDPSGLALITVTMPHTLDDLAEQNRLDLESQTEHEEEETFVLSPLPVRMRSVAVNPSRTLTVPKTDVDEDEYNDDDDDDDELSLSSLNSLSMSEALPDELTMTQLLLQITEVDEDLILMNHGYKRTDKICDTLQGELFKAKSISDDAEFKQVAIKKTDKTLYKEKIANIDGMTFCVEENIVLESLILHHLTVDNRSTANYIVRFIELFESEQHYYLVMEYIEGDCNLQQFVDIAHGFIADGKLSLKDYQKIIKYIFWQLSAVLYWLHHDMHCCHLDLSLENVMLQNASFKEKNGVVTINPAISAKLCDFGRAEIFRVNEHQKSNPFQCGKNSSSTDNVQYLSPKQFNEESYDGRAADMWALGQMLYQSCIGSPLYLFIDDMPDDDEDDSDSDCEQSKFNLAAIKQNGYLALKYGALKKYLQINNLTKFVSNKILNLLDNLLAVNEEKRFKVGNVLQHNWFKSYFSKYRERIHQKSFSQKARLIQQKEKLSTFPFYAYKTSKASLRSLF